MVSILCLITVTTTNWEIFCQISQLYTIFSFVCGIKSTHNTGDLRSDARDTQECSIPYQRWQITKFSSFSVSR